VESLAVFGLQCRDHRPHSVARPRAWQRRIDALLRQLIEDVFGRLHPRAELEGLGLGVVERTFPLRSVRVRWSSGDVLQTLTIGSRTVASRYTSLLEPDLISFPRPRIRHVLTAHRRDVACDTIRRLGARLLRSDLKLPSDRVHALDLLDAAEVFAS